MFDKKQLLLISNFTGKETLNECVRCNHNLKTKIDIPKNCAVNALVICSQIGGHNSYLHFVSEVASVVVCNSKCINVTDESDTEVALPNDKYDQFSCIFKVFKDARWKDVKGKSSIICSYLGRFSPSSKKKKKKKNPPQENFSYSGKMELSYSNIKKFLIFSQKKAFLIF